MSNLESLFNAPAREYKQSPVVKYDYKTQNLRVRLVTDFMKLHGPLIRHWVEGIGWVDCGQKPYKKKDNTFGIWGECVFCQERKKLKDELLAQAIAAGKKELDKDTAKKAGALHKRVFEMVGIGEVEVREKSKVVKELAPGAVKFNVLDMFFNQQNRDFKTLQQIFENKGTLCDNWLVVTGTSIMLDDKVEKAEKKKDKEVIEAVDLSFFDENSKSYEDGFAEYNKKFNANLKAEPVSEDPSDDDESIPF